jgi:PEGA domain-containing protein/protein kinase-like protein
MRTAFGRHRRYVNIRSLNSEDSVLYFPPEAFGPFRVLHQIGAGSLGPVFRAHETGRDRIVAVKIFHLNLDQDQSAAFVAALQRLIEQHVRDQSIAAPLLAGVEGGEPFLVEELAPGDSLDVVLRDHGTLSPAATADLVDALAGAIDAAAARGVTHGALHPRDVLMSADGVRVTGFGVRAALEEAGVAAPERPPYSALGDPSDVYSLAAIAVEAITGARLSAAALEAIERQHGAPLRHAFSSALALDPDLRPSHAGDFAAALRRAIATEEPVAPIEKEPAVVDAALPAAALMVSRDDDPASDLQVDLSPAPPAPIAPVAPLAPFLEPPVERAGNGRFIAILLICGVAAAFVFGYFAVMRSRTSAPPPAQRPAAATKPSVSETTVDVPASPPPVAPPRESPSSLPAPTPSRPASGVVATTPPRSRPAPSRGNLVIRSNPLDADVMVNGTARGKTPLTVRDLPLGSYTIRVTRDGYAPQQRRVELTSRRATTGISFSLTPVAAAAAADKTTAGVGSINVQSRPAGARVFVNDRLVGTTPIAIPNLRAGSAAVRIEMDGYQPWSTTVQVNGGEATRVNASLDRR